MYDSALRRVVEPGTFTIYVGGSSESVQVARLVVTGDPLVLEQAPTRPRLGCDQNSGIGSAPGGAVARSARSKTR